MIRGDKTLDSANAQKILGYFIEEAKEHLETLEQGILDLGNLVNNTEEPTLNTLIWAEILYYKVCTKSQTIHGCLLYILIFFLFVSDRFTRQTIQRSSRRGITEVFRFIMIG